eukprot:12636335-Alexandrium_andersonii.AAC.1
MGDLAVPGGGSGEVGEVRGPVQLYVKVLPDKTDSAIAIGASGIGMATVLPNKTYTAITVEGSDIGMAKTLVAPPL